jgi:hypothetical protein
MGKRLPMAANTMVGMGYARSQVEQRCYRGEFIN